MRSDVDEGSKAATLLAWDRVLGLDLHRRPRERSVPAGAKELIAERNQARAAMDFARSDELREKLRAMGISVSDDPISGD
jgi:cysteinyl-tRNA synthetase